MQVTTTEPMGTIAFVGGGNMAAAMIRGLLQAGWDANRIRVAEPSEERRAFLAGQFGVSASADTVRAVNAAQTVVLAVKPGVVNTVLQEVGQVLHPEALVISIAAGVTLEMLRRGLPAEQPLVRVMPNTPALIGAGISAILPAPGTAKDKRQRAREVMAAAGEVVEVADEALMDGITALSGSGPAYVFLIAEALSDGGVACGLPRSLADTLAVQTLLGSARLLDETGQHPGVLKNQVTSPGGTTIAGLAELERAGVRSALMAAVTAAWHRSLALRGA